MSYTKKVFEDNIIKNVQQIVSTTVERNNIMPLVDIIDSTFEILEGIKKFDLEIGEFWNEITSDIIASINSATSGFYRQGIITLRSVLELGCMSLFYYDHRVEFHLFKEHDAIADKYVSKLIREYNFFTTKYINAFCKNIREIENKEDSVSNYLGTTYKKLSDIVHGRYKTLTKKETLKIEYSQEYFSDFIKHLNSVLSILATMYILRFGDKTNLKIVELANKSRTVAL
ncbi:hypothetical protein AAGS61_06675 [Lysinibacillus sp. KU-BSD001]|uniref:hypothetical protein n=1 Tax=Lysinibacillus sp. KU-BSD001 TaxID=3141328 RepID=UPI0036E20728